MDDPKPYVIVDGVEINDVERKVNDLITQGYVPQSMVIAQPLPGATSRPRYVVPMALNPYPLTVIGEVKESGKLWSG